MTPSLLQYLALGATQGITEWLPVSSSGMLVLLQTLFFPESPLQDMVRVALFLHLGTFFAALIYLLPDVRDLLRTLVRYKEAEADRRKTLHFFVVTSLVSGGVGTLFLYLNASAFDEVILTPKIILAIVGSLLVITGLLQYVAPETASTKKTPGFFDSILTGVMQGIAALPGLSRSGLTVAALLLRRVSEYEALRLSFLLSLPVVLGGNILLSLSSFTLSPGLILAFLTSFGFGLLTIHGLLAFARRTNMGTLVLIFGILTLAASAL